MRERSTQESIVHRGNLPVLLLSSNEPLPILLRFREAARELGVCERQIHNLVAQNLLEKVKLGTKTARITRTSVLKLAGQRATDNTPTAAQARTAQP
jgi:hypothetical protein